MLKCQYPGCHRKTAKYFMGWTDSNGQKRWGYVCATCDRELGRKNLKAYAGMNLPDAIAFEKYAKETEE